MGVGGGGVKHKYDHYGLTFSAALHSILRAMAKLHCLCPLKITVPVFRVTSFFKIENYQSY